MSGRGDEERGLLFWRGNRTDGYTLRWFLLLTNNDSDVNNLRRCQVMSYSIEGSKLAPPATWGGKYKAGVKLPMCVRHALQCNFLWFNSLFLNPPLLFVTLSLLNIFEVAVFAHAQPPHAFSMASQVVIWYTHICTYIM